MTRDDVMQEFGWYEHEGAYREAVWDMADEIVRLRSLTPPPAPRVVLLDEWVVVSKVDRIQSVRVPHRDDDLARIHDEHFPSDAPHRVVRVALVEDVPEATFGNPPRVVVTEAMVKRAAQAMWEGADGVLGAWSKASEQSREHYLSLAQRALTAALADADAGGDDA